MQFPGEKYFPLSDVDKIKVIDKIEVADSESDLVFFSTALVSEIFAFYHLLECARGRPGRCGLGLHGKALVSEILVFLRIRVTCLFQLNDLFCTTKNASINTPST